MKSLDFEGVVLTVKLVQNRKEMDLSKLNISSLAHLCRQSTDRYFRRVEYDDSYCLELFRRAIEQKDETAWYVLVTQYDSLVRAWINRHHSFTIADEDQDYFVNRTFDSFWSAFNSNPKKIAKFRNLKSLLQYLKLCAYTAVQEYVERRMPPRHITQSKIPIEAIAESDDSIRAVDDNLIAGIVWQYVSATTKSEQERVVTEDYLRHDMKPQEIYRRHKDLFTDVAHVRRVKGNFMTRLRRNRQLMAIISETD